MTTTHTGSISYGSIPELALVVLCHSARNPSDLEWQTYLDYLQRLDLGRSAYGLLVDTDGGHPTRSQQQKMSDDARGTSMRVAVISPSTTARFVTSVLMLTNRDVRCFSPAQSLEAYAHLGLPTMATERVNSIRAKVRGRLRP